MNRQTHFQGFLVETRSFSCHWIDVGSRPVGASLSEWVLAIARSTLFAYEYIESIHDFCADVATLCCIWMMADYVPANSSEAMRILMQLLSLTHPCLRISLACFFHCSHVFVSCSLNTSIILTSHNWVVSSGHQRRCVCCWGHDAGAPGLRKVSICHRMKIWFLSCKYIVMWDVWAPNYGFCESMYKLDMSFWVAVLKYYARIDKTVHSIWGCAVCMRPLLQCKIQFCMLYLFWLLR